MDNVCTEGIDYEVSYADNINAGTASVILTGKGEYAGELRVVPFTITPKAMAASMVAAVENVTYTGSALMPKPAVTDAERGVTLVEGTDYTLSYANNEKAGTATVMVIGNGNYTGTVSKHFTISKATYDISGVAWSYSSPFTYDGDSHSVTLGGLPLGVSVKSYSNDSKTAAGNYTATVTFNYDTVNYNEPVIGACNWSIMPRAITFTAPTKSKSYDGTPLTFGAAEIVVGGEGYVQGEALTLGNFADITEAGTADATFTVADGTALLSNYAITTEPGTLTVTRRPVTLTSGSASKPYDGTALVKHEVAVGGDGFATGEGASYNFTGSQTAVGTSANTFTYTLNEGTKAGNYDITTVNGMLTITKATVGPGGGGGDEPGGGEVPTGGESKFDVTAMYDGEGHTIDTNALTAAFGTTMIGEFAVEYATDDGSGNGGPGVPVQPWLAEAPAYTNAGEYVVWYRVSNPNYEDFIHAAKVTITNRPVTVTVVGHTATYGYDTTEKSVAGCEATTEDGLYDIAADTAFRGGHAGRVPLPGVVVFDDVTVARTDVGTTAMGLTASDFANNDANFLVTYLVTDGWVKVEPRVIGDDPANWDIRLARNPMYDGTLQNAPITQVAFVKPDGNLDNIPYTLSGNTATDAGNYVVRITGTGNYSGTMEKEWAITPRNVSLTSGSAEWVYDGEAHSETAVTVGGDGFADGEGASYSGFPVVRHVSDAAAPTANAFTYALNANTKANNYSITTANGTVKMLPRAITLTAPTKSKPYDGSALTFGADEVTAALNGEGGAAGVRALPEGESFTFGNFASITEAGRVDATFTVSDGTALTGDYAITTVPGSLTVTRSATEITVTAKSGSWTYDGQPHSLHEYEATNLGTLQAGDALEVTFSDESVATTPLDGPEGNGVVANVITGVRVLRNGTDDVTANYTLAPYNGTLTVTRRPVTLTSKSDTKVYDGEPLTAHEVTVGGDGFVGEDGATYAFTGSQTEKGTSKNAFAYTLKSGTNAAHYDITKVEGDLEVTATDISAGTEEDWQITFGPALVYTGLEQIQTLASVTYKGLPLDYSVTGNAQTDAGTYQMTLTGQGNFSGTHQVAWSIAPKSLTLTAGSGSRVYDGTAFKVGTVTASGFVAGEGATYTCTGSQKDVGSSANEVSAIGWNANTKGSNYAVTKVAGALTVTPRPVTLTAANLSKPYDGTPLALTAADIAASGLVAGESFVFSDFASRTEAGQTPATFSYAAGPGTSHANYSVTVTAGRMITITKSATAISVTAASESWVYDGEAHSNRTWTATNLSTLQSGDELEVTFDEASVVTTPQDGPAQDGVVANVITGVRVLRSSGGPQSLAAEDVTANYSVEWFPGTLAVTKRPVTVTVTGRTATYTYDGEEKSVTGYDATTADTLYDIAADTAFGGIATTNRTDAGKSDMGLKAADFTNNDDCFDVTYAVTDGWVKIEPLDIAAADDGDFALVLGANPKYNGTVQTIPVESVTCVGLPVTYTLAGENATHAGTYTLTVKANGNFTGERSTAWQMLKRAVTLTSGSASKVYDGSPLANPNVTIGGDGFIGIEGATFEVTGSQTLAGTSKNTFAYTLKAGTQAGDYDITRIEGDLTVTKARYPGQEPGGAGIAWNVAADAASWMYDGAEHGVSLAGVPAGVTPHIAGNRATDVGAYTASVTIDFDAANYEPPSVPAPIAWSITKRPITLMAASKDKPYDGFPLEVKPGDITASGSGYAPGECFEYFDMASITEVGEIPATFSYRDSATAKVSNYAVTVVGGQTLKVTVGGDQISVTADSATWAYDGEPHALPTWTVFNGNKLLAGHVLQVKVSEESVIETPRDGEAHDGIVSNRFEHVRIVDSATGADKTRNYNLLVYEGVLQITNRVICSEEVIVNGGQFTERVEKVYDGVATGAVVTAGLLQPARVRYLGDVSPSAEPPAGEWRDEPPQFVDAGTYTVWYEVTADYYDAYTGKVVVAIAKRPVTLTSPTKAKPYDGAALTFGAGEIAVGGDGFADGESFAFGDFAVLADAGRTEATFAYAAGANTCLDNYAVTVVNGTLTVRASADEITVTAKSGSWPYDGEGHVLHACEVANGDVLQAGDELVVAYDAASVATTPDDGEVENRIASVKVMRGGTDGEDVTRNYSIVTYPGKIRVVNATMAVDGAAFSTSATYDGEKHTIAVTAPVLLTSPVVVSYLDDVSSSTGQWKSDPMAVGAKDAGTHTIRYRISARYYDDFFGDVTVTILPRPVTLVSAGAEKVYDGTPLRRDEVAVKAGALGFADGEGFVATCRGSLTDVGGMENLFDYTLNAGTKADNYAITKEYGWLRVTPATLDPADVFGGAGAGDSPLVCEKTYNGAAQPVEIVPNFDEPCRFYWTLAEGDERAYAETPPTLRDVADGDLVVYFKFMSPNFAPYYGKVVFRIVPKALTDEMVQLADEAFFYDPDSGQKTPSVTVSDTNAVGTVISTANDYDIAYGDSTSVGAVPVTVTGRNNYAGTVTKTFPILKRPVAPPVIGTKSYNGRTQKATVTADSRWTVVRNNGGINAGEYEVLLRLTNTDDYRWKDLGEDEAEWTGVFRITKGSNRWTRYPGMTGWTDGETPSEPTTGSALRGTVQVAYRRKGTDVSTETATKPSSPGAYVARFWVDETENFIGLALTVPYEIEFTIAPAPGSATETQTTPVPVPYVWLDPYLTKYGSGDYEAAGHATGANGHALWESYVAGLDPEDPASRFRAFIEMLSDNTPKVTWSPDLRTAEKPRLYTILGKAKLSDKDWTSVTDANKSQMRFFKVKVEMK